MQHLNCIIIRTMASQSKQTKLTLSSKLAKQNKVVKPKAIITKKETMIFVRIVEIKLFSIRNKAFVV